MSTQFNHDNTQLALFTQDSVRDIAWILYSTPLLSTLEPYHAFQFNHLSNEKTQHWLCELDQSELPNSIQRKHFTRLGLYYESLLEFIFTEGYRAGICPFRLVVRNLQVVENKITLGEFDFLIENDLGEQWHIETAIKFYLAQYFDNPANENWIGPNARDRLSIKLHRTHSHQLTLSRNSSAQTLLAKYNIHADSLKLGYLMQGMLFTHISTQQSPAAIQWPSCFSTNGLKGFWMHENEFNLELETPKKLFGYKLNKLDKLEWISGKSKEDSNSGEDLPFLPKMYELHPDLMCEKPLQANAEKKLNIHTQRLMVVSNYWPETSSPSRKI